MRTKYNNELRIENVGEKVTLVGWCSKKRNLGGLVFIDLRDRSGIIQLVVEPDNENYQLASEVKNEYVLKATGHVVERESKNPNLETGDVEVIVEELEILNTAENPPLLIQDQTDALEDTRMKYRYLDLRRPTMQHNLIVRHKTTIAVRNYFDENGFIEIETPYLGKSTPEGARDFLVPSRVHTGSFYALPQSPQLYKQLLMVAGFDKYFQIAKCFRDEDLRADRQPEFTQVDLEMSFVEQEDVINLVEGLVKDAFGVIDVKLPEKFPRMTWQEAMDKYGSDKPDTRFGLELFDLGDILAESDFDAMKEVLNNGGIIKGITIPNASTYSRKEIDDLRPLALSYGAKGLANIIFNADGTAKSPVLKFLKEGQLEQIKERAKAKDGDVVFFIADKPKVTYDAMGRFRLYFGKKLNLINPDDHAVLWVVDFPMFEYSEEEGRYMAMHHPFTMPNPEDLDKMENDKAHCRSIAYDIVYNGTELGGGSVRIHRGDIQERVFKALGLSEEDIQKKFGFLVTAFKYGTPPHAGLAIGLDRLIALMAKTDSIRDVIAFPKNSGAKCLMTDAPAEVTEEQLRELHLKSTARLHK